MKKIAIVPLLIMAAVLPARAEGTKDFTVTAKIAIGNQNTKQLGGVTELASPCLGTIQTPVPAGAAQGIDGYWIQLPENIEGLKAELVGTVTDAQVYSVGDVDAWYYDDGCNLITPNDDNPEAYYMATSTAHERGIIPPDAAWVCVDLVSGANESFTFTVHDVPA